MNYPLVSVIIPNYNHSKYLVERIESVLNQVYENFEVIILDDCSNDNSREVISQYRKHPKVSHIVYNESNSGTTFKQWQKGFNLSQGDYIWIAESDDSMDPRFLQDIMFGINSFDSVALAFTNTVLITSEGFEIDADPDLDDYCKSRYSLHKGMDFIYDKMLYRNRIYNASAVVFKRDILTQIDSEYLNYRFCGDWVFWIEVLRNGNVLWLHEKYNRFRKHSNKVSPKADLEGVDYKEKHRLIKYLKYRFDLSYMQVISFVGNVYLNLLRSHVISKEARKRELKTWVNEYPAILFYALVRVFQVLPRRLLFKLGFCKKYKKPHVINQICK